LKVSPQLKQFTFPDVARSPAMIGQKAFAPSLVADKLLVANLLAGKTGMKSSFVFKTDLKTDNLLRTGVMSKTAIKTDTAVKTSPALKSQLQTLLDVGISPINLRTPAFKTPRTPTFKTPNPKIPIALWFENKKQKAQKKGSKKGITELAYLPDFTSRAIGLNAETISGSQAEKRLKKLLTGLEVRRPVKVKW